jgi:transcriptional regulator GlxA family with amidase domain
MIVDWETGTTDEGPRRQRMVDVESVATKVGLSSAINLRHHFHRHLRTTPAAYRRAFRQLP